MKQIPIGKELIAGTDDGGRRLDRILRRAFPDLPLSMIHRLLRQGRVTIDGIPGTASARIAPGSCIQVREAALCEWEEKGDRPPECPSEPAAGISPDLRVIWEGNGLLFVNKPAGLAVHCPDPRGPGRDRAAPRPCLDDQVRSYLQGALGPSLSFRPGPLHRLDQVSSGIIVFSTSLAGAQAFSALMRERRLKKTYLALVDGCIKKEETWEDTLLRDSAGKKTLALSGEATEGEVKPALTRVFPLAVRAPYSLIALEIETGRTHQIRSQAAFHGRPLAGDRKYGGSFQNGGLFLHAFSLSFPAEGLPPALGELCGKTVSAPLPKPFLRRIREVGFGNVIREFLEKTL